MEAAPYDTPLLVRAGGMEFPAELIAHNAMNDREEMVDQWCATTEVYPACWSDGCCWESNADEAMSAQPEAWAYREAP
jgi:hypothetical protein